MLQREQDSSDECPTTYVALSLPTCTTPMSAQRWSTQAPSGMFRSWGSCATIRENPSSNRSPNPACPMGHSEMTTSWRTQLAFSSMASRSSQPPPPQSTAARTTGPSSRHTSAVRINSQRPLTKKTKETDSHQCTHHTIQQIIHFQNICSMEHSSRTPSTTHQPTPI